MTRDSAPPAVVLKKDLARSIRRGHPWIYRDALAGRDGLESGGLVEVRTRDGRRSRAASGTRARRSRCACWSRAGPAIASRTPRPWSPSGCGRRSTGVWQLLDLTRTNAFRWVHGEADLLPGIHVDFYADTAVVRFDGDGARAFYEPLEPRLREAAGDALCRCAPSSTATPRPAAPAGRARGAGERRRASSSTWRTRRRAASSSTSARTGRVVAERARGASVLNLFGYTGGFSVHAAAAGARRTDTVDIARPRDRGGATQLRAQRPVAGERRLPRRRRLRLPDGSARKRGDHWDIVISDPPSFAPRKDAVPAALQAYRRLHRLAAAVTRAGRPALRRLLLQPLRPATTSSQSIEDGVRQAGRRWRLESAARRRLRPPEPAGVPGRRLPQVRDRPPTVRPQLAKAERSSATEGQQVARRLVAPD